MTAFLRQKEDKFEGCLLVLNIGQENIRDHSKEYTETLKSVAADAHADGFMTLYAFDSDTGPMRIPEIFDNVEGMDFVRMMFDVCGRQDSNFSLNPEARMGEFRAMAERITLPRREPCHSWAIL